MVYEVSQVVERSVDTYFLDGSLASKDGYEREASEDGRTAFDLSTAIVMKSDAPLE